MLITFERKVPQSSYTSQNDHKSKGYPSKTSVAAFTIKAPWGSAFEIDFQKSYFPALICFHDFDQPGQGAKSWFVHVGGKLLTVGQRDPGLHLQHGGWNDTSLTFLLPTWQDLDTRHKRMRTYYPKLNQGQLNGIVDSSLIFMVVRWDLLMIRWNELMLCPATPSTASSPHTLTRLSRGPTATTTGYLGSQSGPNLLIWCWQSPEQVMGGTSTGLPSPPFVLLASGETHQNIWIFMSMGK